MRMHEYPKRKAADWRTRGDATPSAVTSAGAAWFPMARIIESIRLRCCRLTVSSCAISWARSEVVMVVCCVAETAGARPANDRELYQFWNLRKRFCVCMLDNRCFTSKEYNHETGLDHPTPRAGIGAERVRRRSRRINR